MCMDQTMSVKEVSLLLGIPEHTVRYYTDMGMIPNIRRAENNYREFDEEAVEWLKGTVYFRQLGLSLKDIRYYHDLCFAEGDEAVKERYRLLKRYCEKAEEEVKQAQERLEYLRYITEKDRKIAEELLPDSRNPFKNRKD